MDGFQNVPNSFPRTIVCVFTNWIQSFVDVDWKFAENYTALHSAICLQRRTNYTGSRSIEISKALPDRQSLSLCHGLDDATGDYLIKQGLFLLITNNGKHHQVLN